MTVSCISCSLDRSTSQMGSLKTDIVNGAAGSYTLRYIVQMASAASPVSIFLNGVASSPNPLPSLWATYSYQGDTDAKSYAKNFTVERDPRNVAWYYVTVQYEPAQPGEIPEGGGSPIASEPNPLLRAPKYYWDRELTNRVEAIALGSNVPVLNAANNLYEELEEHERANGLLVCEFNLATQGEFIDLSRRFDQAVNATSWPFRGRVFGDRSVMIRQISGGESMQEGSHTYFPVAIRFAFAYLGKTWDVTKPELGQSYYIKSGGAYSLDSSGFRKRGDAGTVVPLNADGTRRADGDGVLTSDWRIRRETNFSTLPSIIT